MVILRIRKKCGVHDMSENKIWQDTSCTISWQGSFEEIHKTVRSLCSVYRRHTEHVSMLRNSISGNRIEYRTNASSVMQKCLPYLRPLKKSYGQLWGYTLLGTSRIRHTPIRPTITHFFHTEAMHIARIDFCKNETNARTQQTKFTILYMSDIWSLFH